MAAPGLTKSVAQDVHTESPEKPWSGGCLSIVHDIGPTAQTRPSHCAQSMMSQLKAGAASLLCMWAEHERQIRANQVVCRHSNTNRAVHLRNPGTQPDIVSTSRVQFHAPPLHFRHNSTWPPRSAQKDALWVAFSRLRWFPCGQTPCLVARVITQSWPPAS